MENLRIEITFKSGESVIYNPEDWDDYAYDGKSVIVKIPAPQGAGSGYTDVKIPKRGK